MYFIPQGRVKSSAFCTIYIYIYVTECPKSMTSGSNDVEGYVALFNALCLSLGKIGEGFVDKKRRRTIIRENSYQ